MQEDSFSMDEVQETDVVAQQDGPGAALAAARQAHGLDIAEVAGRLKFAPRQIEALEAGRYDLLPGLTIVRGMVRSYARVLDLDPEPLVVELEARMQSGPQTVQPRDMHVPIRESNRGSRLYLVLSLIVLIAVGAALLEWYVRDERATQTASGALPTTPAAVVPAPIAPSAEASPGTAGDAIDGTLPTADAAMASEPDALDASPAAAAADASTPASVVAAAETAAATAVDAATEGTLLQMRFSAQTWVEVRDARGKVLAAQLSPAGSQLGLDGQPPLSVIIGKASAVELRYRGKPVDLAPHARADVARLTLD